MAGLLDIFDTEEGRLGLGLLMAAAPRANGAGVGQRIGEAYGYVQQQRAAEEERGMKKALQDAQIANYTSEADNRRATIENQRRLSGLLSSIFGGDQSAERLPAGAYAPSVGGMGPVAPTPATRPGLGGMSLDQVVAVKAAGGPDLLEAWKLQNVGTPMSSGSYVTRADGSREYLPDPSKGLVFGPGGASVMPGFAQANATIKGAEAGATAQANAGFDMVTVETPGGPVMMTRAQAARMSSGAGPSAPAAPPASFGKPANVSSPGYNGGSRDTANAESLRIMESELARATNPQDIAAIQREIARLRQQTPDLPMAGAPSASLPVTATPSMPGIPLISGAEKTRLTEQAKADVTRNEANITKGGKAGDMLEQLSRARELLSQRPTESLLGTGMDKIAGAFGASPPGAKPAASLRTLQGWLTSNVPRMEGPQSDADRRQYEVMAGLVGDSTVPVAQRQAAISEIERIMKKYAHLNASGVAGSSNPATQNPSSQGASKRFRWVNGELVQE